jgi:hypothetical protein
MELFYKGSHVCSRQGQDLLSLPRQSVARLRHDKAVVSRDKGAKGERPSLGVAALISGMRGC